MVGMKTVSANSGAVRVLVSLAASAAAPRVENLSGRTLTMVARFGQ